ncbi:lasso peptide biosynthesis B2 protein [Pseudothauera nasutitermitis]|uniref:Lasso peptide biosynthesis B2 protein n=1 Tax=Pseudothauera nasutitermitis TaxID=2565930 RepID=A0A4V3WBX0_9RHOO|nr:lasso peptide biosynthesis B2 protein [Pseudothauera nasutitermitis]THF64869.1 lasso peptide biosynthesis B2 protein [Pseudothauera nasutitermitis]
MTSYRLHDDLSFCHIDGRLIFLDTREDRYFLLSDHLERAFDAHTEGIDLPPDDIARLVERNIITDAPPSTRSSRSSIANASRSALELSSTPTPSSFGAVAELFAIILRTKVLLKTQRLQATLDDAIAYRTRHASLERRDTEERLLDSAHAFLRARKLIPIDTRCLLDSLSMMIFLARRHLHSNIVFGVTNDPFTAHCWVQTGDLILNDAVGNTRAYATIRVI